MPKTVHIQSWTHFNDLVYHDSWQPKIGRFRSPYAFRGTPFPSPLISTLLRLGGPIPQNENHLLRNFRKYASPSSVPKDSIWNWLALAQHHGLPTRLLYWTYSPFVALHFATSDASTMTSDGIIRCVNYPQLHRLLPQKLRRALQHEGADVFTTEILQRISPTLNDLSRLSKTPFPLFLEPPSLDDRIVTQSALVSLMSSPTTQLEDWLKRHPRLHRALILPANLKWEFRDKLDQAHITERTLFPGLDGLTQWLTRYYSPNPQIRSQKPI